MKLVKTTTKKEQKLFLTTFLLDTTPRQWHRFDAYHDQSH